MIFMTFHSVGIFIIPTDFHIFQRGWVYHQPVFNRGLIRDVISFHSDLRGVDM